MKGRLSHSRTQSISQLVFQSANQSTPIITIKQSSHIGAEGRGLRVGIEHFPFLTCPVLPHPLYLQTGDEHRGNTQHIRTHLVTISLFPPTPTPAFQHPSLLLPLLLPHHPSKLKAEARMECVVACPDVSPASNFTPTLLMSIMISWRHAAPCPALPWGAGGVTCWGGAGGGVAGGRRFISREACTAFRALP